MESVKDYLLSVTAASLICGILSNISSKNSSISTLVKLLCGVFLTVTVIRPLVDLKLEDVYILADGLTINSDLAVSQGEKIADDEMKRIIKQKTEAYILDKAKALGADITAQITLQDYVPASVTIIGDVSPYVKSNLSANIAQELNIPPEEQVWKRS